MKQQWGMAAKKNIAMQASALLTEWGYLTRGKIATPLHQSHLIPHDFLSEHLIFRRLLHTLEHGQRARRRASEVENVSCEELALFGLRKTQGTERVFTESV